MTNEQAIHDLYVIKDFFEEQSGATPLCIEYALEMLEKADNADETICKGKRRT